MRLVIVSGMSGAGKTVALKDLEDMGYYCVDNLPVALMSKFVELLEHNDIPYDNFALSIDIRNGKELGKLESELKKLSDSGYTYEILFLDASDETLIKRFKETRRTHPLNPGGRVEEGIRREREKIGFLRQSADYVIDTSKLLTKELRAQVENIFSGNTEFENLYITIVSFGFKYGIPTDADLLFDVRFLPNPYYVEELRNKTGRDEDVRAYVMGDENGKKFLEKLYDMLDFLIPRYIAEGKNQLVIGIGCTGGKHRSVTVAGELYSHLCHDEDFGLKLEHRDIDRK